MLWLNLLILAPAAVGHAELMVILVNRLDALPISRPSLKKIRMAVDCSILSFPLVLLWFVGFHGATVLLGGSWSNLSTAWCVYLAVCGVALMAFFASVIRWQSRRSPAVQISNHSRTVDIAQRLGFKPIGNGKHRFLATLPLNEAFKVQVSDKRYVLPRLPREWHELSILHLTDSHFIGNVDRPFFEEIARLSEEMRPDLVVFTGDLLDDLELLPWLPATFGRLKAPLGCYYSLGNHDWFYGADEIRAEFNGCGWQDTAGRSIVVEHHGHRLEIAGTERPWMGQHPEFGAAEFGTAKFGTGETNSAPSAFRLLLSHTPDHIAWARSQSVDLMLSGHNHGGQIILPVIGPVFAPSKYGVRYAGGAFWTDPTFLYVSRGLAGRHPLRLNCPPELTRLILESPSVRALDRT